MEDLPTRKTLLLRIQDADDDRAWSEFVEIYSPIVFAFCLNRGLQEADASDIVQEVMSGVLKSIGKFEYDPAKGTFRAWLFRITRNKLNDFFQRRYRQPIGSGRTTVLRLIEETADSEEEAEAEWDFEYKKKLFYWAAEKVRHEFQENTWRAFWGTAVEQKPPAEVADALGISTGAAYIAKSRVIARISNKIAAIAGENDLGIVMG